MTPRPQDGSRRVRATRSWAWSSSCSTPCHCWVSVLVTVHQFRQGTDGACIEVGKPKPVAVLSVRCEAKPAQEAPGLRAKAKAGQSNQGASSSNSLEEENHRGCPQSKPIKSHLLLGCEPITRRRSLLSPYSLGA